MKKYFNVTFRSKAVKLVGGWIFKLFYRLPTAFNKTGQGQFQGLQKGYYDIAQLLGK
jgi:hypothetical protein